MRTHFYRLLSLIALLSLPTLVQTFTIVPNGGKAVASSHLTELTEPPDKAPSSSAKKDELADEKLAMTAKSAALIKNDETVPSPASTILDEKPLTVEAVELLHAIETKHESEKVILVAQVAPSVRVAIAEEFGHPPGSYTTGQLVAALKALGFDYVLDTNTAADLTICEEGTELLHRLEQKINSTTTTSDGTNLPLFTSCCPGWMNLVQKSAPELASYISSCKSPHMMYGALVKEFSQEWWNTSSDKVYFTSVMPCVRKRAESDHECFQNIDTGERHVDNVITTRDLGQLLRQQRNIDPGELEPELFDSPFSQMDGLGTGAGQLFGATGGVMEAAIRTAYELVSHKELPRLELDAVRGLEGVKEATIHIPLKQDPSSDSENAKEMEVKVAVVNGLGNAKKLIQELKAGNVQYDFVEVMACPGGCINGGGQPKSTPAVVDQRLNHVYELDRSLPRRKSHENPVVKKLYAEYLQDEYGSPKAHQLLHVTPIYGETQAAAAATAAKASTDE